MRLKPLLFLPFLLASALVFAEYSYIPSSFIVVGSRVTLVGLTSSSTNIVQGSPTDLSLTMRNDGTLSTTATSWIAIYSSDNSLIDNVTFDPVDIAPSQTVTLTKTWSSGNNLPGLYRAIARAEYEGNLTNSLNITFIIFQPSAPNIQPPQIPIIIPPVIKPLKGAVNFIKTAVLQEIMAGQGVVESILLKNTGEKNLTIDLQLSGIPPSWIVNPPSKTVILPGETRVLNIPIAVPKDASSGNYLVRLDAMSEGASAEDFLNLRVKSYPVNYDKPIAAKTIKIDGESGKTTVSIDLKNPSKNIMNSITLTEKIPAAFSGASIDFLDKPGVIYETGGSRFIKWEFKDLSPLEEVHFSYTISQVLSEYSTYANWYIYQIATTQKIELSDLVKVMDFKTQVAEDGTSANVSASVLYVGVDPISVTMLLETPEGFKVEPTTITTTLIPRGVSYAEFSLKLPQTDEETHLLRFVVLGDKFSVYSTSPIVIRKPTPIPAFSILSLLSLEQVVAISSFMAAAVTISILSYRRVRKGPNPEYNQERLDYMKNIKKMVVNKNRK